MIPISPPVAPAAIGPYPQAVTANGFLFASGQLPSDPATDAFAAGTDLSQCVKTSTFLTGLGAFAEVNAVYAEAFAAPYPAQSTFQVAGLPKGARVEVEAVIALPEKA